MFFVNLKLYLRDMTDYFPTLTWLFLLLGLHYCSRGCDTYFKWSRHNLNPFRRRFLCSAAPAAVGYVCCFHCCCAIEPTVVQKLPFWQSRLLKQLLLRGVILNRTYNTDRNISISLLYQQYLVLLTMVPRNKYDPPRSTWCDKTCDNYEYLCTGSTSNYSSELKSAAAVLLPYFCCTAVVLRFRKNAGSRRVIMAPYNPIPDRLGNFSE